MKELTPSDLKTILHSKRANLYYLEHCRVLVNGGRVEYLTEQGSESLYWNIRIANTTSILMGSGTSITQAAMRELSKAGVLVGFCGGGGSPLYAATEVEPDVIWLSSQSEYRPTEYLQRWVSFWFDEEKRIKAAKKLQIIRLENIEKYWIELQKKHKSSLNLNSDQLVDILRRNRKIVADCNSVNEVLNREAVLTKSLYKIIIEATKYGEFTRSKRGTGQDLANQFLDYGNYLMYGLAATSLWVLGIPHGLAVLHGKTRRGGLVFDIADLLKDALVLPQAFVSAVQGHDEGQFKNLCISAFLKASVIDHMIDTIKTIVSSVGTEEL